MDKLSVAIAAAVGALVFGSAGVSPTSPAATAPIEFPQSPIKLVLSAAPAPAIATALGAYSGPHSIELPDSLKPAPPPPAPQQALRDGVLIVVSLASQQAFVFRKGEEWDSTTVSTGKAGHETPNGVFTILQKDLLHRSTLYEDAPMPYMQRITWDGVALHAGRVPGYAASHGCIRLPKPFAQKLFAITNFSSTVVVVTDEQLASAEDARKLA